MTLNLQLPQSPVMKPIITVFGVGGAGGNATNNMIKKNLEGANFIIANTDAQALDMAVADKRIQLGQNTTKGLGAGADPAIGREAAEEAREEIEKHLEGSNMVFVTAGMGGGTGTGASSVIARIAREMGILTVGVVTKPFHFEGPRRMRVAEQGIAELQKNVDTLIVIPNQNLFRIANEKTTFAEAFAMADEVLNAGVRGVTDLMVMPGLINLDFADIRTVMSEMGKAMMGTGESSGEKRAQEAADAAISNPLLDNVSMKGAKGVLINITGGPDMTLFEVDEAANRIREEVDPSANVIFGSTFDDAMEGKIRVSVVATGIEHDFSTQNDEFDAVIENSRNKQRFIPASPSLTSAARQEQPNKVESTKTISEHDIERKTPAAALDSSSQQSASSQNKTEEQQVSQNKKEETKTSEYSIEEEKKKAAQRYEETVKRMQWKLDKPIETQGEAEVKNEVQEQSSKQTQHVSSDVIKQPTQPETQRVFTSAPAVQPESYQIDPALTESRWNNHQSNGAVQNTSVATEQKSESSIFSRMARGVAKPFYGSDKEDLNHVHDGWRHDRWQRDETSSASESGDDNASDGDTKDDRISQEDLLDIPAFLRRK